MSARLLLGASLTLFVSGCAASDRGPTAPTPAAAARGDARPGWKLFTSAPGGFSISMPVPTRERQASEGPVSMRLVSSKDEQGMTYEATYFDMPTALEQPERAELLEKIQVGLAGGPGVRLLDRRDVVTDGVSGRQLILALPKEHAGTWRIFYVGGRRMFQLSVVGPAGQERDDAASAFFESFKLRQVQDEAL